MAAISAKNDDTKSSGSCGGGASENLLRFGGGASAILCGASRSPLVSVMRLGAWLLRGGAAVLPGFLDVE